MKYNLLILFSFLCLYPYSQAQIDTVTLIVTQNKNLKNKDADDVKFHTIESALEKASSIKQNSPITPIKISIDAGFYRLDTTIHITSLLNGMVIENMTEENPIVTGSQAIDLNWEKHNEHIFVAHFPENLVFDQFFVDDEPQVLARYPNYNENGGYWNGFSADAISPERVERWENPQGGIFHALHKGRWGGFHFLIKGKDENNTLILDGGHQNNRPSAPHDEYRMVENIFEELDHPGEWYADFTTHKIYFYPTEEMDLESSAFEVSVLKELIKIKGTKNHPVKNVKISGLTFKNSGRTLMDHYEPLLRSDWTIYRGSALFIEYTENCQINDCTFQNLGGNVLMASRYNRGLEIKRNHIHDCGGSAIAFIGDASAVRSPSFQYGEFVPFAQMDTLKGPKNDLYPKACLVENNLIHDIGTVEKQTAGVQIAMAMEITVRHNSIYNVPRAGINIGDGTWGGHVLEYNDVFNTVLETSDHGSFNSWGRDRFWHPKRHIMDSLNKEHPKMHTWDAVHTTIIRNNRFRCDHGWDIDLDDGSSNYHIYNNLCLNSGIKLREGFNRVVENNILVNNSLHPHVWFEKSLDVFKHNIVEKSYQDVGLQGWGKSLDSNFFTNETFMMKSRVYNMDQNSAYGDPMFVDPQNLDFSVHPSSPALSVGFVNFRMDKFGVQTKHLKSKALTPEVPIRSSNNVVESQNVEVQWLRNTLKSVESPQEQSAYGLNSDEGVIVLKTWNQSPAVKNNGIQRGDVILATNNQKTRNVKDFFTIISKYQDIGQVNLTVMRNQKEQTLTIHIK